MSDLRRHFEKIAGPAPETATTAVQALAEADLVRGRRALRRRRTLQSVAGSAFGVAALVAVFAVTTSGGAGEPSAPIAADRSTTAAKVQLVAYKGEQPKGFTVDKVPSGWFIQNDDNYSLVFAPEKAKNPGPDVNPSADPLYDPNSFVDKIVVMLESKDQSGPSRDGKKVKVGDQEGLLLKSLPGMTPDGKESPAPGGDTGSELWVKQPSGIYMIIQVWQGVGLSEAQIVELGAGVHVHEGAQQGVG
ncbi:hypothetical protein [Paractinoplanes atraurantiacus]|uniref:Uncharacterized protein n=1 Tax=Paractinoplanes atraurantiacus TaxID=1036182 RepID=A0A285JQX5_9ACTN|nr:hypothetical protein [Actinoplanes atraurantiacus]SNY62177.1 hypothetical protein SAMN05421748_12397 [Actinoplanes atraurantiacus]